MDPMGFREAVIQPLFSRPTIVCFGGCSSDADCGLQAQKDINHFDVYNRCL